MNTNMTYEDEKGWKHTATTKGVRIDWGQYPEFSKTEVQKIIKEIDEIGNELGFLEDWV